MNKLNLRNKIVRAITYITFFSCYGWLGAEILEKFFS